jgi:P-type conjugative transfer protein TrbL
MRKTSLLIWVFLCFFLSYSIEFDPNSAEGATIEDSTNSNYIMDQFISKTNDIQNQILVYTRHLWGGLFILSFAWACVQLALGENLSLMSILSTIVRHLFYGFFFLLLIDNPDWIHAIYKSFGKIGEIIAQSAGGAQEIINAGVKIFQSIYDTIANMGNFLTVAVLCIGILPIAAIIFCCFCVAASSYILMKIEALIVISVGIIMLGFGGALTTRDMAISYLKYTVSYGLKLLTLRVLVGIMKSIIDIWVAVLPSLQGTVFITYVLQLMGASFIFLMLVLKLPNILTGILSGASIGTVGDLGAARGAMASGASVINRVSPAAGIGIMGAANSTRSLARKLRGSSERNGAQPGNPSASNETGSGHPNYVPAPKDSKA